MVYHGKELVRLQKTFMRACEDIADQTIRGEPERSLQVAGYITNYVGLPWQDRKVWIPLISEALDLHHRRAASMPNWAAS